MATHEQMVAMGTALTTAQTHISNLSTEMDKMRINNDFAMADATAKHEANLVAVRQEASDAVADMKQRLNLLESKGGSSGHVQRPQQLINVKKFDPKSYEGKMTEDIKPWAKSIRNYCNACRPGFRIAMEWAELQNEPINQAELLSMNWADAIEADTELYEYLQTVTSKEAQILVEKYPMQGFEAWRQLHKRANPQGGRFQLATVMNLMRRTQVKTIAELPAAADKLEKDIREFEKRAPEKFPEYLKMPLLAQLLPDKVREEVERKFGLGEKDYQKVMDEIVNYSVEQRAVKSGSGGPTPMDLDSLGAELPQAPSEVIDAYKEYTTDLEGRLAYYEQPDVSLDYMGKKGKGYGKKGEWKGKGGKKGSWKGKDKGAGKKGDTETRVCHWCQKPGHLKMFCTEWWAGKPKVQPGKGVNALDQEGDGKGTGNGGLEDWEEDAGHLEEEEDDGADAIEEEDDEEDDESEDFDYITDSVEETPQTVKRIPLIQPYTPAQTDTGPSELTEKIKREQQAVIEMLKSATPPPPAPSSEVRPARKTQQPKVDPPVTEHPETSDDEDDRQEPDMASSSDEDMSPREVAMHPHRGDVNCHIGRLHLENQKKLKKKRDLTNERDEVFEVISDTEQVIIDNEQDAGKKSKPAVSSKSKTKGLLVENKNRNKSHKAKVRKNLPEVRKNLFGIPVEMENPKRQDVASNREEATNFRQKRRAKRMAMEQNEEVPDLKTEMGKVTDLKTEVEEVMDIKTEVDRLPDLKKDQENIQVESKEASDTQATFGRKTNTPATGRKTKPEVPHLKTESHRIKEIEVEREVDIGNTSEASTQTEVSLKSTQTNVMWTASVLKTIVDACESEENASESGSEEYQSVDSPATIGDMVDMLDSLEEQSEDTQEQAENEEQSIWLIIPMLIIMTLIIIISATAMGNQVKDANHDIPIMMLSTRSDSVWNKVGPKGKTMKPAVKTRKMRLKRGITMDSGAANNVMPKRMITKRNKIRPSPGSIKGTHYVAANNGRIPNEGEYDFEFETNEGQKKSLCFQVAEVNKALGSISYLVDHDYRIVFDKDEESGVDISSMVHKPTGTVTRFRRQKNVWILDAIIEAEETPFPRRA